MRRSYDAGWSLRWRAQISKNRRVTVLLSSTAGFEHQNNTVRASVPMVAFPATAQLLAHLPPVLKDSPAQIVRLKGGVS